MSETGTEQVKEVETAQAPQIQQSPQDELLKIARKQLFFQRISAVCMVVVTLVVVLAVIRVVPQVETTLNHINNVALKAEDSLAQVDDMTDGLTKASENLNKLVDDNAEELTNAVKQISEVDFDGLNKAITDLQGAVGPISNFFGKFK